MDAKFEFCKTHYLICNSVFGGPRRQGLPLPLSAQFTLGFPDSSYRKVMESRYCIIRYSDIMTAIIS